ncbi:hypothetical protein HanPSC8_Chr11g0454311 [Helianthus annuus]|nr:hypothetical protein HanPSC8_Chr11g0454311 [Helianthus annuus]
MRNNCEFFFLMKFNLSSDKPFDPFLKLLVAQLLNDVVVRNILRHRSFNCSPSDLRLRSFQFFRYRKTLVLRQILRLTPPVDFYIFQI